MESKYAIQFENITQRFRVIHERPDTLRELFSKLFRQDRTYYDFDAVRSVSLDILRAQTVGVIGRNGSGKSTLLKIAAGVYKPTEGKVTVNGTLAPLIELGAGFHHELTGRENILLNGLLMGYSKREMVDREERIIEFADIGEFIDVPVKQYSSGMYMRLAFAVAVEVDPEILLIDEILAVGDESFQQKCFERLESFQKSGKTILLVSHDMQLIEKHCNHAILLEHGMVMANGDPVEVIEAYKGLWTPEAVGAN
jgi:ABC-type polysaccharide/polyol phosphate transport system ATPase subunit